MRHAERAAGVSGGRLDPDLLERTFAKDPAVADAVERDAARQTQIFSCRFRDARSRHLQHRPLR